MKTFPKTPPILISSYSLLAMKLDGTLASVSSLSSGEITKYPYVIKAITDVDKAMLIGTWSPGIVYSSYGNSLSSNPSIIQYDDSVYVCISNNLKNLKDQSNSSHYSPVNNTTLPDGYQWLNIFDKLSNDNGSYTKIPSYDKMIAKINSDETSFCTSANGVTGTCSLYQVSGSTGSLIAGFTASCSVCTSLAQALADNTFFVQFSGTSGAAEVSVETIEQKLTKILTKPSVFRTDFSLSSYASNLTAGLSAGCILSAFIESEGLFTGVSEGLTIGVTGDGASGGTGANISFIYSGVVGNTGNITGITLTNRGAGYGSDVTATVVGMPGASGTALAAAISLIVPANGHTISTGISSIFDLESSFSADVVTRIKTNINPKAEGISFNAYALLTNVTDNKLPANVTGVKHIDPLNTANTSPLTDLFFATTFIR